PCPRHRPAAGEREQDRGDGEVVLDHRALGGPGGGVHHLVLIGEAELAARDRRGLSHDHSFNVGARGPLAPIVRHRTSFWLPLAPSSQLRLRSPMRAIWSGSISFGLVNVPVKAYTAV